MLENDFNQLIPGDSREEDMVDQVLVELLEQRRALHSFDPVSQLPEADWDAPFDLRVMRPRAIDLRKLWQFLGQSEPPGIAATLGPRRPILLNHAITPFPRDDRMPGGVWGLGYEFVPHDVDASTVSIAPDNEVLKLGKIGHEFALGLDLGGKISIPQGEGKAGDGLAVSLTGAALRATTSLSFQFALGLRITLRKIVGAAVGVGGAQWKIYRQNEPLDQSHPLLQTLLVPEGTQSIRCTIKTWARQAGFLGTRWGSVFWPYADQSFDISLTTS